MPKTAEQNNPTAEKPGRTARSYELPTTTPSYERRLIPVGEGCYKRLELDGAE